MLSDELPEVDMTQALSYNHIRYVTGYPEEYVKEYAREVIAPLIEQIKKDEALLTSALGILRMWHIGASPDVVTINTMHAIRQRLEAKK